MSAKFSDNTLQILNPITNNEVGRFDISTNSIISDTIKSSKNYDKWSLLTVSKRCYHIKKLRKALVKHQDEIHNTLKNEY